MLGRCLAIFGAGVSFVLAVAPSYAADDIEAKAQACAACHGQNGVPTDPKTIPIIWGQEQSYLVKQLQRHSVCSNEKGPARGPEKSSYST